MHGSRDFCQVGSRLNCQKQLWRFFFFFLSPQFILQFYRGCPMVISKKTIIFQGFRGSPTFSRWGGVQMLISIENHITRGGGGSGPPIPPSGSAHVCRYKLSIAYIPTVIHLQFWAYGSWGSLFPIPMTYESRTLFFMTSLRYHCIKALHPRDKNMRKRCRMRKSLYPAATHG